MFLCTPLSWDGSGKLGLDEVSPHRGISDWRFQISKGVQPLSGLRRIENAGTQGSSEATLGWMMESLQDSLAALGLCVFALEIWVNSGNSCKSNSETPHVVSYGNANGISDWRFQISKGDATAFRVVED
jgi:hypothetical protein